MTDIKVTLNGEGLPVTNVKFSSGLFNDGNEWKQPSPVKGVDIVDGKAVFSAAPTEFKFRDLSVSFPAAPRPIPIRGPDCCEADVLYLHPLLFEVNHVQDHGFEIEIDSRVRCRQTGQVMPLNFRLPIARSLTGNARAMKIRELLLWAMTHELNEALVYSTGEHVVEPHPELKQSDGGWRFRGTHPEIRQMQKDADEYDGRPPSWSTLREVDS